MATPLGRPVAFQQAPQKNYRNRLVNSYDQTSERPTGRSRRWEHPRITMGQSVSREPWHAVSIVGGANACAAATAISGKRFLAAEAPLIPLPKCTASHRCKCAYRHFPDRRTLQRRASDRGMYGKRTGHDRREKRGRRAEDLA